MLWWWYLTFCCCDVWRWADLSWIEVRDTLFSPKVLVLAIIDFFMLVPVYSTAFYMPTLIKDFGFSTLHANALTSPIYALAIVTSLVNSWHSDKQKERLWHVLIPTLGTAVCYAAQAVAMKYQVVGAELTLLFLTTALTWASVGPFFGWLARYCSALSPAFGDAN